MTSSKVISISIAALYVSLQLLLTTPVYAQTPTISLSTTEDPDQTPTPTPLIPPEAAKTGIDLTVSPVFINLLTNPGEPTSTEIKIKNNSNVDEYLEPEILRFEASNDGSQPDLQDLEPNDPFPSWVTFSEDRFRIAPNQVKTIQVTISPPESASLGYYYAVAFRRIAEDAGETASLVSGAPAVSLLLEVTSPNTTREVQVLDFFTDKFIYEYLPTEFNVYVHNSGNIHMVPYGDIFIDSMFNEDVGVIRINASRGNVLPQSERIYTAEWDDAMIVRTSTDDEGNTITNENGETQYTTEVDLTKANKFRIGKYTATAILVYDNGDRDVPLEATVSFWVIPWKIILVAILIILFILIGLRSMIAGAFRRLRRKETST